jgi:peptidyl-prolyl cis-trans isomerase A (cyclophilin A)
MPSHPEFAVRRVFFSILLRDLPNMDADPENPDPARHAGYAAFGHVIEGMEVVEAIHAAPIDPELGEGWMKGEMLAEPVEIVSARRASE